MYDRIKEEIDRLLKANFIRPCGYAEWISNIVPLEKKGSSKIRICINFRNLNRATRKDEYSMPNANMLINDASGHKVLTFLMVMLVTIKFLWSKTIYTKRPLDVLVLLARLSELS
jgi:hypothetical protein